jgi:hypothetical protein
VGAAFPPGRMPYGLEAAAIVLIRGWKAAPTGIFCSNLDIPDTRKKLFRSDFCHLRFFN